MSQPPRASGAPEETGSHQGLGPPAQDRTSLAVHPAQDTETWRASPQPPGAVVTWAQDTDGNSGAGRILPKLTRENKAQG